MFSGLRRKQSQLNGKQEAGSKSSRISTHSNVSSRDQVFGLRKAPNANTNTTNANTISLVSGNLVLGSRPQKSEKNDDDSTNQSQRKIRLQSADSTIRSGLELHNDFENGSNLNDIFSHSKSTKLQLSYHESRISEELILVNVDSIPGCREGSLCELKTFHKNQNSYIQNNNENVSIKDNKKHFKKIFFIAKNIKSINDKSTQNKTLNSSLSNTQISICQGQLQALLGLSPRSPVWIKVKEKNENAMADLVELHIRDFLLNRGDMWLLSSKIQDTCVFENQKLSFSNSTVRTTVKAIYKGGRKVLSGYIGESTKISFRSDSARLIFLIQITEEMWNFEENGEQLFQKLVNSFFPKIFQRWEHLDTHHTISIAFCISMDISDSHSYKNLKPGEKLQNTTDYYRIVVDQVNIIHWIHIMNTLKKEFMTLVRDLKNHKEIVNDKEITNIKGNITPAIKSNFLEMINFASTYLIDPFNEIDLKRTASHLMIVTPGSGLYDVDYDLLRLTTKKLLSLEMGVDLISLSSSPLHIVPLFRYIDYQGTLHHCIPTWVSIFFWNESTKNDSEKWQPRCKFYNLQMTGLSEQDILKEVEMEQLDTHISDSKVAKSVSEFIELYDNEVFLPAKTRRPQSNSDLSIAPVESKPLMSHSEFSSKERLLTLTAGSTSSNLGSNHWSDVVENSDLKHRKPIQASSNLIWNKTKFAKPIVEQVQKPQVVADMQLFLDNDSDEIQSTTLTKLQPVNAELITPQMSHQSMSNDSLVALDSLKGISRQINSRNITKNLVNRLLFEKRPATSTLTQTSPVVEENIQEAMIEDRISKSRASSFVSKRSRNLDAMTTPLLNSFQMNTPSPASVASIANNEFPEMGAYYSKNKTWVEIANPSFPLEYGSNDLFIPIRWRDVYPKDVPKKYSKWKSFSTPAELPYTINDFPTKDDFANNFIFRNHSVTPNIDQKAFNRPCKYLILDMIYARLISGFQICTGPNVEKVELSKNPNAGVNTISKYFNGDITRKKIYMMLDSEIHRLSYVTEGVIDIQRYLRSDDSNPYLQVPSYTPLVKTKYEKDYRPIESDPIHARRQSLNWNQIDQIIAGYGEYIRDDEEKGPGFRAKFIILPNDAAPNNYTTMINGRNETLSPEEWRLEGLRKLVTSINRSRINQDSKDSKEEIVPEITFYTGSLFELIDKQKESLDRSAISFKDSIFTKIKSKLKRDIDIQVLAEKLQDSQDPLDLTTRTWHWKKFKHCFVGSELVSWLLRHFSDIETREAALEYGQQLLDKGLFRHVFNKHGFLDGHYFYVLNAKYILKAAVENDANGDNSEQVESHSMHSSVLTPKIFKALKSSSPPASSVQSKDKSQKPVVLLSSSLSINFDTTGQSEKLEIGTVHYDRVHNPDHCFHLRLEWLTVTPKLIDDLIGNWSRICERYGLKMIEVPWEELFKIPKHNPFHSFVEITTVINPWKDEEFNFEEIFSANYYFYHRHLLKSFGFYLDNRASRFLHSANIDFEVRYSWGKPEFKYAQYIHDTGACIAEIREDGSLFLAPNNAYISRISQGNVTGKFRQSITTALDTESIISNLQKICNSYAELRPIFIEAKNKYLSEFNRS